MSFSYSEREPHGKPGEKSRRVSAGRDAYVNVLVEVAVEVTTYAVHCGIELGRELDGLVAAVINLGGTVRMGELEADFLFCNSTVVVKQDNV